MVKNTIKTLVIVFFLLNSNIMAEELNLHLCKSPVVHLNPVLFNLNRQVENPTIPELPDPFANSQERKDVPLWTSGIRNGIDERRGIEWRDMRPSSDGFIWYYDEIYKLWWRVINSRSQSIIVNNAPICST